VKEHSLDSLTVTARPISRCCVGTKSDARLPRRLKESKEVTQAKREATTEPWQHKKVALALGAQRRKLSTVFFSSRHLICAHANAAAGAVVRAFKPLADLPCKSWSALALACEKRVEVMRY